MCYETSHEDNFVDLWLNVSNCQIEQKGRQKTTEEGEMLINEQFARQEPLLFSLVWGVKTEAVSKGK